jgi:hypothetical protein
VRRFEGAACGVLRVRRAAVRCAGNAVIIFRVSTVVNLGHLEGVYTGFAIVFFDFI